ncbi:hypothetical protein DVH24_039026 [Malus domestica]|uniref:Uncharacterized protein n=1 Tax=Malus domestica TaxID=3750 RepID=A0A498KGS6_MALDO|nr:hypothetical protein DVH24_039026 [Malus domestica]
MASSSKKSKSISVSPYNLPLTRVHSQEKEHHDILNDYNIWWELGHDIYANLPPLSDPCHPCTRIYSWHFVVLYNIAIYNLSHAAFRLLTCFNDSGLSYIYPSLECCTTSDRVWMAIIIVRPELVSLGRYTFRTSSATTRIGTMIY